MKAFDIHVHLFPDPIAQKATNATGAFYSLPMRYDGKLSTAISAFDRAGIGRFAAHSVASSAHQVPSINRFILTCAGQYPGRLIPFAAIHPEQADLADYAENCAADGFYGVKLHPDIQHFQIDCPAAMDMFAAIEGRLPAIIHTGDRRYDNSGPARMLHVLKTFPRLTCVMAHLGGYSEWDEAVRLLPGTGAYVDTSSSLFALPPARARDIIRAFGADRVLFGTDYPMWDAEEELSRFFALNLTPEENEKILHQNAEKLLGLSPDVDADS